MPGQNEYKVGEKASLGLYLRSEPVVKPSTIKILLPMGHVVTKLADSTTAGWWEVSTSIQGMDLTGFASSKFLVPISEFTGPQPHSSVSPVHLRPGNNKITRSGEGRAFPLNEAGQPTRESSATALTKAQQLTSIVNWLKVEQSKRYKSPGPGTTYCNIYSYDYCYLAGAYLPRVWWRPEAIIKLNAGQSIEPNYATNLVEMRANMLFNWLEDYGQQFGWARTVDLTAMQNAANDGQIAIICAQRTNLAKAGHICPVVPETSAQKAVRSGTQVTRPLQSQAGGTNFRYKSWVWWTSGQFREFGFWIHA
jgi:hypothetical protein